MQHVLEFFFDYGSPFSYRTALEELVMDEVRFEASGPLGAGTP